jgi:hypothetical protein
MKAPTWLLWSAALSLCVACGGGGYADSAPSQEYALPESKMAYDEEAGTPRFANEPLAETPEPAERKIIRTANLRMQVKSFEQASQDIRGLAQRFGAEIASEEVQQYGEMLENRMTVRVKPERFDSLLHSLEQLAIHLDFRSVNAEDVTRQYIDLETRLAAKRAVVERYRELLQQAKNVTEVLNVEENLRKVVEEIESVEGQLRYLSRQVQMSTIQLTYYERSRQPLAQRSFWSRIGDGFAQGWQLLKDLAVALVAAWPIVLIILAVIWWWRRRRQRNS